MTLTYIHLFQPDSLELWGHLVMFQSTTLEGQLGLSEELLRGGTVTSYVPTQIPGRLQSPVWQPTLRVPWCLIWWFASIVMNMAIHDIKMSLLIPGVIKQHKTINPDEMYILKEKFLSKANSLGEKNHIFTALCKPKINGTNACMYDWIYCF